MGKVLSAPGAIAGVIAAAVVFAIVVVIQSGAMHAPDTHAILATPVPAGVPAAEWHQALHRATRSLAGVSSGQSDAITDGWIGVIAALIIGIGLVALIGRRSGSETGTELTQPLPPKTNQADARDRSVLIDACIDVSETVPSASHREELLEALAKVGVEPIEVSPGERFDSKQHRAVGVVRSTDPSELNRVAKTERAGFADHGRRIRPPRVLVYRDREGGDV